MPLHDWTRVDAGIYHDFHQGWTISLRNALNAGRLPHGYFAMADQVVEGPIPDVLTLRSDSPSPGPGRESPEGATLLLAEVPPRTRFTVLADEEEVYARRANRILVRHRLGEVVAVIKIVSPGNKSNRTALYAFVTKARDLLDKGVHLLIVDPFPPGRRDPQGIHKAIWDEIRDDPFELPADKPLTLVSYRAGSPKTAYIEPVAVGDLLPEMPLFLNAERYVPAPLEASYAAAWEVCPRPIRDLVAPE